MNQDLMKQKITAYIKTAWQWHKSGNGPLTEGPGLQMRNLEEEILTGYGLPYLAFQYSEMLQFEGFSNRNIGKRAAGLMEDLQQAATNFLLSPIEKDETVLQESKATLQDGMEVLPMIGISTAHYNLFLYYDFYFKNLLNEQALLQHLKKAEALDKLAETRIPYTYQTFKNGNHTKRLMQAGIPFLQEYQQYLKYLSTKQKWDIGFSENENKSKAVLYDTIELSRFFITYIGAKNEDMAVMEILAPINNSFVRLRIWCTAEIITLILLQAKYYSLSIPAMYVLNPRYLNNGEMHVRLKESKDKNIEIDKLVIGLERQTDEPGNIPYYTVKYLKPMVTIPATLEPGQIDEYPF
jgi:hypothetical protein